VAAAMLKALYGGDIEAVDPFVCMLAEPHRAGSEMGELQHAVIADVFTKVRDGDRRGLTSLPQPCLHIYIERER